MFTLKIGTFGVPIWFKCFKDISNNDAFKLNTMKEGIEAVSKLFKNADFNLVFLADRWFGSSKILDIFACSNFFIFFLYCSINQIKL